MTRVLILVAFAGLISCQSPVVEDDQKTTIEKLEAEIKEHEEMDTAVARQLTDAYLEYVDNNLEDSISPYYLSRAANVYQEMPGQVLKSVTTYNKVITAFPEHPLAARSVFMIGYLFDNKLNDKERAIRSYNHFVATYPDHELADDARNLLNLLQDTLSDEQMVEKWIKATEDTNPKAN